MQTTRLSHFKYIFVLFPVLYLKTTFLNSLKIMKKSLTTEFSDLCNGRELRTRLSIAKEMKD